jgi:hypothetical protein
MLKQVDLVKEEIEKLYPNKQWSERSKTTIENNP